MTFPCDTLPIRTRDAANTRLTVVSLATLLAILVTVLFISMRSPLKDDIAWLLYVAHRWMAGRELYVDLVEVNPPLIVWISAIPLQLAGWLHLDTRYVVMPLFIAAVLGCAGLTATLLQVFGGIFRQAAPVFAVIGSVLLILPAADLGQREHLLVAAFLPYLVLFARSLEGYRAKVTTQAVVGFIAGLGCALKPHYGVAFAALECLGLIKGLRPWRIAPIIAALTLFGYAALVAYECPAYLRRAIPMTLALYGATDVPLSSLLSTNALVLSGEALALILYVRARKTVNIPSLLASLLVFATASTFICFIDGKDWYYHRLPATIATVLALATWCFSASSHDRPALRPVLGIAFAAILCFFATALQRWEPEVSVAVEPAPTTVDRLEKIIHDEHARTYVAFSEWIALGFPVVNNTGVTWASRFDSMWALKGEVWRTKFDPATEREWPIARWVTHDFIAGCPEIAVVDTRETTKYISVLSAADPAFARAWSRYWPIASFDGLVVYKRRRGGCIDAWVAADAGRDRKPH